METAKVDIEKLQQLNDRIVQTLEALNQVRMSVHGLQSAARAGGQIPGAQFGGYGLSHTGGFGQQNPWLQQQNPWAQQQNPWQQIPWQQQQQIPQQFSPQFSQFSQYPQVGGVGGFGLSHTGIDPYRLGAVDPTVYARIVQTFPFLVTDPNMRQFF